MFQKIKDNWQKFKNGKPGHRFQDRYEERRRESHGKFNFGKIANIGAGLVIAVAGVFFIPAPGPGAMIIFLGLGMIGSEFLPLARALDWAELRVRALVDWAKGAWARASLPLKAVMALVVLGCAAGVAYGAYEIFWGSKGGSGR